MPAVQSDAAGIIIVDGAPDPGASSPDEAGIIIIDGAPDPGASSPDEAGIIIHGAPDPSETVNLDPPAMVNQEGGLGKPDEPGIGDARTPSMNR